MADCPHQAQEIAQTGDQALIHALRTPVNSEEHAMAQAVGAMINKPWPGATADGWFNLRSVETLLNTGAGVNFPEHFPSSGPMTIEAMERILQGATHGTDRIREVPDWKQTGLHEGDIVANAPHAADIGRTTCGWVASLGVVQADGTVAKFNSGKKEIVAATEFFSQPDVRVFRLQH